MSPRFPLLIGITGKREFDKRDADGDRRIAQCVAEKFKAIFHRLDRAYPHTPKIVLTGLAFGADLIAAEIAFGMESPDWAVVGILPFDHVLFEEDFQAPAGIEAGWRDRYAEHASAFRAMLAHADPGTAQPPRVMVRELPKLRVGGARATPEQLSRESSAYDPALRRNHYEQVGQFIAEAATIMIAVMPANERPTTDKADGGTARVVACRRAGRPDALGQEVAARSEILRAEWPELVAPPGGFVWLIEPKADGFNAGTGRGLPVTALPPLADSPFEDVYAGEPGSDLPEGEAEQGHELFEFSHYVTSEARRDRKEKARALRGSLALAKGFERFNALTVPLPASEQRADISAVSDIVAEIEECRRITSKHQGGSNATSRWVFKVLAILFVSAIGSFEIFAKFFPKESLFLFFYILVLLAIASFVIWARIARLQPVSEDYRAVSEMLRVQRAWWAAGARSRVDWQHLQGADRDLARVRDAAKSIIAWLLVRRGWFPERDKDWSVVRGKSAQPRRIDPRDRCPTDWIGSQIWYFKKNAPLREETVRISEAASWTFFIASGWLAAILCAWLQWPWVYDALRLGVVSVAASPSLGFVGGTLLWLLLAFGTIRLRVENRNLKRSVAIVATFVVALIAAVCFAFAAVNAAPVVAELVQRYGHDHTADEHEAIKHAAEHIAVVGLVVLSAWAGAWRYLTERRNIEAEALEYPEAQGRFERAERLLAPGSDPTTGAPLDEPRARALTVELGLLALDENEAWLKSRRERPLTPVVG